MTNKTKTTVLVIAFVVLGSIAIKLLSDLIDGDIVEQVKSGSAPECEVVKGGDL